MKKENSGGTTADLVQLVNEFVATSTGLKVAVAVDGNLEVIQTADDRRIRFHTEELKEVLPREDKDGKNFIQVNFRNGGKILLTDSLVGFKPSPQRGLDLERLPKVVTTPDLLSVFEAIEEALNTEPTAADEVEILKRVFSAILEGGEAVGFDLKAERIWISRLAISTAASA